MSDDPRRLGGDIAGPGGPRDKDAVIVDTRNAVILDGTDVSLVETWHGDERGHAIALLMRGRINKTSERTQVLYLMNEDGVAGIITELAALAARAEQEGVLTGFRATIMERLASLREQDAI